MLKLKPRLKFALLLTATSFAFLAEPAFSFFGCFRGDDSAKTIKKLAHDTLLVVGEAYEKENKCSVSFLLKLATVAKSDTKPQASAAQTMAWDAIDNHSSVKTFISQYAGTKNRPLETETVLDGLKKAADCSGRCTSEELNRAYESLLADEILKSGNGGPLNSAFKGIFDKIMAQIEAKHDIDGVMKKFETLPASYPLTELSPEKKSTMGNNMKEQLKTRPDYFMDFLMSFGNDYRHQGSPMMKKSAKDQYASLRMGVRYLTATQDQCYVTRISPKRGGRFTQLPSNKPNAQRGFTEASLPSLQDTNKEEWTHSYQKYAFTPDDNAEYIQNTKSAGIPLVCGISGSTNIFLWTLLDLGVDLEPKELRLFLTSAWSTLAADGGHSLQEVLSASKIIGQAISDDFPANSKENKKEWEKAKKLLPKETVSSLKKFIKPLSATGSDKGDFGAYGKLFRSLAKDYPEFQTAVDSARSKLAAHYQKQCEPQ